QRGHLGQPLHPALRGPGLLARRPQDGTLRDHRGPPLLTSLTPETGPGVAPDGPEWLVSDFPEDLPVSMDEHVQKAVDCYNAGATVLHLHVREEDGTGSKRLSKFNEFLERLRDAVPDMILQVGGSISFAPEAEGEAAKWLSDDTRHMLAELQPTPDQVTIAINTNQMNIVEQMCDADL